MKKRYNICGEKCYAPFYVQIKPIPYFLGALILPYNNFDIVVLKPGFQKKR